MTKPDYPEQIATLVHSAPLSSLGPGSPVASVREQLSRLSPDRLGTGTVRDHSMAQACLCGLWLAYNYLDESHEISQGLSTSTGSYWHGLMHRREPDYSNAKYWFRRTGHHPAMDQVASRIHCIVEDQELDRYTNFLADPTWDAIAMVDACEAATVGRTQQAERLREVAHIEWIALFEYCYARAFDQGPV